jgi:hypothetical protein
MGTREEWSVELCASSSSASVCLGGWGECWRSDLETSLQRRLLEFGPSTYQSHTVPPKLVASSLQAPRYSVVIWVQSFLRCPHGPSVVG